MPSLDEVIAEIDQWFADEVQRAPLSYNTEIYNQMHAAKASLRNRLSVVITGEPLPSPIPPADEPNAGAQGPNADAQEPETPKEPETVPGEAEESSGTTKTPIKPKA